MIQMINKEFTLARLSTLWSLARSDAQKKLLERALCLVINTQAEDVAPVKHGQWVIVSGRCTLGGDPVWMCSECGKGQHVYGVEHGTYGADIADGQWVTCPNCGAIMTGEVGDGT